MRILWIYLAIGLLTDIGLVRRMREMDSLTFCRHLLFGLLVGPLASIQVAVQLLIRIAGVLILGAKWNPLPPPKE